MRKFTSVIVAILTFLVLFTVYQSYAPHPDIYQVVEANIVRVEKIHSALEIEYNIKILIEDYHNNSMVQRQLINTKTGLIFDFPIAYRYFDLGGLKECSIILEAPGGVPTGDYIIRTIIVWQPMASIEDHWFALPDIHLTVP
jgi:hypothetical protein